MRDIEIVRKALYHAVHELAQHSELGPRNAEATVHRLLQILHNPDVTAVQERLVQGFEQLRKYRGFDPDCTAKTDADYFGKCPVCGAYFDTLDLALLLTHLHDQEIEVGEGDGPPPREGPVQ